MDGQHAIAARHIHYKVKTEHVVLRILQVSSCKHELMFVLFERMVENMRISGAIVLV